MIRRPQNSPRSSGNGAATSCETSITKKATASASEVKDEKPQPDASQRRGGLADNARDAGDLFPTIALGPAGSRRRAGRRPPPRRPAGRRTAGRNHRRPLSQDLGTLCRGTRVVAQRPGPRRRVGRSPGIMDRQTGSARGGDVRLGPGRSPSRRPLGPAVQRSRPRNARPAEHGPPVRRGRHGLQGPGVGRRDDLEAPRRGTVGRQAADDPDAGGLRVGQGGSPGCVADGRQDHQLRAVSGVRLARRAPPMGPPRPGSRPHSPGRSKRSRLPKDLLARSCRRLGLEGPAGRAGLRPDD